VSADVRDVREVADQIVAGWGDAYAEDGIEVYLEGDEIVVSGGGVRETYDTPEEAITGLRASWTDPGRPARRVRS
jgi:hypothetical protein